MKKSIYVLIALFTVLAFTGNSYSQDENMKKWMDYMTPGDMQKMLSKGAGSWNMKTTWWMAPGAEAMVSEATAESEMILGGRYLQSKVSGSMMGMPFDGISIEGYDNAAKLFVNSWIDNMGTGMMFMTGTWDEAARQINYSGKMVDPLSGNWVDVRQVVTYNADGSVKMEMYGPAADGKEYKTMEIINTKK
ncbi:MAG: DUF1579 domain-containing protein [Ignavibacteria bacterium]|nr:DUF1579 domain-containing protein [Ignavibacteria bacterium]